MPIRDRIQKQRARAWLQAPERADYRDAFLAAANSERFETAHGWFAPTVSNVHAMLARDIAIVADMAMSHADCCWSEYLEQTAFLLRERVLREVDISSGRAVLEVLHLSREFARIFLFDSKLNGRLVLARCQHLECRRYFVTDHDARVHCSDSCKNAYYRAGLKKQRLHSIKPRRTTRNAL